MTTIKIITKIKASKQNVFDLSRNIDFHLSTMNRTNEKAIDGKTTGLIEKNESVTWRGKHFGFHLTHKSLITQMNKYESFTDEMVKGHFKSFVHHHRFITENNFTVMTDEIIYKTPFGILGKIFNETVLKNYLTKLITNRNRHIKSFAEKQSDLIRSL